MESERQKKIIVMKILVASIAVLIFVFWVFNIPNVWQANKTKIAENSNSAKWDELKREIDSSLGDMQNKLDNIEEKAKLVSDADGLLEGVMQKAGEISSSTATTSTSSPEMIASSTFSVPPLINPELKNSGCPPYIDCMPTIGEARPCQVPPGCEGITQIAY
ncbi:MAG: hypothetical protein WCT50_01820 [Patescibacteria group bacterium]|jgi:hypothetical protein